MLNKIESAKQALELANEGVSEAKENLANAISESFPKGTMVFFKSGRGEGSAPVVTVAGEYLFLDTAKGKKVHYTEVSTVASTVA